ncbi:hypothetical protein LCGC14_0393290 [marine sediment metagenome]|uniref:Uncharacterized protein n=1 Tax=marine sediment metagenome TaxID=412755 RepID=A0A0F9W843_9ZZZZ
MKEVKVGKLNKEQFAEFERLQQEGKELDLMFGTFKSKQQAFWNDLRDTNSLPYGKACYIKGNSIYTQEM